MITFINSTTGERYIARVDTEEFYSISIMREERGGAVTCVKFVADTESRALGELNTIAKMFHMSHTLNYGGEISPEVVECELLIWNLDEWYISVKDLGL